MATKLTKAVARTVVDHAGQPLTITLTVEGILFRRPRSRAAFLLPYTAGETRAEMLEANRQLAAKGIAPKPVARVRRGLL